LLKISGLKKLKKKKKKKNARQNVDPNILNITKRETRQTQTQVFAFISFSLLSSSRRESWSWSCGTGDGCSVQRAQRGAARGPQHSSSSKKGRP